VRGVGKKSRKIFFAAERVLINSRGGIVRIIGEENTKQQECTRWGSELKKHMRLGASHPEPHCS